MGQSVLVFVSHSSEDKESFVEPIVNDLSSCFIQVWFDKTNILPGENLRKSIFRNGLDKADIVLIFFTQQSLKSAWVDREIKHVLREETKKGNDFNLNKIISIFDCQDTYNQISERYPELTDDLLHLMPKDYSKIELGKLISAIWSKYLSLQGGDIETQRQLLEKDKEIFQKEKEIQSLNKEIETLKSSSSKEISEHEEFQKYLDSESLNDFIESGIKLLSSSAVDRLLIGNLEEATAFGLTENDYNDELNNVTISEKGKEFFKWYFLTQK